MFQKIAKHRANDASNDVHRPPLDGGGSCGLSGGERVQAVVEEIDEGALARTQQGRRGKSKY